MRRWIWLVVVLVTLLPVAEGASSVRGVLGASLLVVPLLLLIAKIGRRPVSRWPELSTGAFFRVVGIVAAVELVAAAIISHAVFGGIPHVQDSAAQLMHARIFALGHLWVPAPHPAGFFVFPNMILGERWYSEYPPGHVAMLALGLLVHAPQLVNPILGSASVALIALVARELWGPTVGALASVLALASPFILFMSSEYMNHATALFAFALALLGYLRARRTGRLVDAAIAGFGLAWLILTRPYTAFGLAPPFALELVLALRGDPKLLRTLWPVALGGVLGVVGMLAFNAATTGHALRFGYVEAYGAEHLPSFGANPFGALGQASAAVYTPVDALRVTLAGLNALNLQLLGWPVPALAVVALPFALGIADRWCRTFAGAIATLVVAYAAHKYHDFCFGPRYFYEGVALAIPLAARGLVALRERFEGATLSARAFAMVPVFGVAFSVLVCMPLLGREYASGYWGVDHHLLDELERNHIERGVIFVDALGSVFPQNDPLLRGPIIWAWDHGEANANLMALHPDLPAWVERDEKLVPLK
ncbi:MAG: glycosyltransferase family 39 protein [Deltaproteobacteria bacterium]|nr:glycosyltransferase family 39 protein [Deltaproteobacteria bacterium]